MTRWSTVLLPLMLAVVAALVALATADEVRIGFLIGAAVLLVLAGGIGIGLGSARFRSLRDLSDDELRAHAYRVANRMMLADPDDKKHGRLHPRSPLGRNTTISLHLLREQREAEKRFPRRKQRPPRRTRSYPDRLQDRFVAVVEELARRGIADQGLTRYVNSPPGPKDRGDAAIQLVWFAEYLPGGSEAHRRR